MREQLCLLYENRFKFTNIAILKFKSSNWFQCNLLVEKYLWFVLWKLLLVCFTNLYDKKWSEIKISQN